METKSIEQVRIENRIANLIVGASRLRAEARRLTCRDNGRHKAAMNRDARKCEIEIADLRRQLDQIKRGA